MTKQFLRKIKRKNRTIPRQSIVLKRNAKVWCCILASSLYCITIAPIESKVHIAILTNEIRYHYAKIANSFKLTSFKATVAIHLRIRHMPTSHLSFKIVSFSQAHWVQFVCFKVPVCNFTKFNKAYLICFGWDAKLFFFHF